MILCDTQIESLCLDPNAAMIHPFIPSQLRVLGNEHAISFGLSSMGYDIRVADEYRIFTNQHTGVLDPKRMDQKFLHDVAGKGYCIIPPNSFALARSVERIKMPRDVIAICLGKSTYARMGIIVNVTPLEPGWDGFITLELSNTTPIPSKVYSNEGIAQLLFFRGQPCRTSYGDRMGKYQHQEGVTLARI